MRCAALHHEADPCPAFQVEIDGGKATVTRDVDGGMETMSAALPLVVTTDLRLNEPRYATLPNIMKAKKKKIDATDPGTLGVDVSSRVKIVEVAEPPVRQGGGKVDEVAGLVAALKDKGLL